MKLTKICLSALCLLSTMAIHASAYDETSVAGLFPITNQGRSVYNFNPNWRFHLGDAEGAERTDYDDSAWETVSVPHSVKLEPAEASGCRNYQGVAWYRKEFVVQDNNSTVYFEAIMGKQKIYVNGKLAVEHYGGYLPLLVDLKKEGLKKGDKCVLAVMADNSNDKTFPPGKPQYTLDFAYHGGIYRDVWEIDRKDVYITDVTQENRRDAGVFVHFADISPKQATVYVDVDLRNDGTKQRKVTVEQELVDAAGKVVKRTSQSVALPGNGNHQSVKQSFVVKSPHLWSPETPYLYSVVTRIKDGKTVLDGGKTRLGIRSFEFKGKEGFWLNGKKYRQFIGANRHQDFAYVGNAVPNSQQWRDVKRLKDAGFNIIRTAHYPQDPAFMDACDELGIFIIVATPGWQYWNKDPLFAERVYQNTKDIIRRDRNHPSVLMWEPILNETRYPKDFALQSLQLTKDEYPYPYRPVAVADWNSAGVKENYDVVYGWPDMDMTDIRQCVLTREFGEYVDDWYAHNNLNRASRSWGEKPMLTQAYSLAKTTEEMHTPGQFVGGCQWHPFDHQRGYHPDPYWGGIYDAFRQKKTAYYMFESQRKDSAFVHIAHEMTQFSDQDVTVFSNCDSVRLTTYQGAHVYTLPVKHPTSEAFNAPVVFPKAWDFWEAREYSYKKKSPQTVVMVAEGFKDGKVVCTDRRMPSRRSTKLRLYADNMGKQLVADGSDFVVVVAEVTDDNGHVRRLAKENIRFTIEGEGELIGDGKDINANPRATEWGSAPILVRSTMKPGKIKIHAEVQFPGTHAPTPADLEMESVPYTGMWNTGSAVSCGNAKKAPQVSHASAKESVPAEFTPEQKAKMLKEVQDQQADFGINN